MQEPRRYPLAKGLLCTLHMQKEKKTRNHSEAANFEHWTPQGSLAIMETRLVFIAFMVFIACTHLCVEIYEYVAWRAEIGTCWWSWLAGLMVQGYMVFA